MKTKSPVHKPCSRRSFLHTASLAAAATVVGGFSRATVSAQSQTPSSDLAVIEPNESDALLANPGMGWQTFHSFADGDPNLKGLPSSSAYFRFYWREIEPKDGEIDFAKFDGLLARARRAGQQFCFRVMCTGSGSHMDVPAWLKEQGCRGFDFEYGGRNHWVPDFEDARFQKAHFRLIRALGARYNAHPDVDLVDIGSVGLWGEWHMSGTKQADTGKPVALPTMATRLALIDAWREAFPDKPKVMLIGEIDGLRHAVRHGCGWRADCLGDMGGFSKNWNHMRDCYPQHLERAGAVEAWKQAPAAFESCWDMRKWKSEGWDIRHIFDYALARHVSYVNNKSAPIPDGTREEVERFLRKAGYRLVLRKVEHERRARPGPPFIVRMEWDNAGVAPPYGNHVLAFRWTRADDPQARWTIVTKTSIRGWLPGRKTVTEEHIGPASQSAPPAHSRPGRYDLALALVDPATRQPAVQLAIAGRAADGWYPLGQVEVEKNR